MSAERTPRESEGEKREDLEDGTRRMLCSTCARAMEADATSEAERNRGSHEGNQTTTESPGQIGLTANGAAKAKAKQQAERSERTKERRASKRAAEGRPLREGCEKGEK